VIGGARRKSEPDIPEPNIPHGWGLVGDTPSGDALDKFESWFFR
jgi:hypothetical protein